jgi:dTDP-4-dehydrorhamnose reductase
MKVWIPGGKGMLGTDLAAALARRGHEVIATGRELDIADSAALAPFLEDVRPSHVINCAAFTAVDACEGEKALAARINVDGPARIGEAAQRHGIHATQISTDYVFAGDASAPYREDAATGPLSVYGRTKLAGERAFSEATAGGGAVLRTSWLFGVHGKCFPATMWRAMGEREELRVVDDQRGRPTWTVDLAEALVDVAERRLAGVWHFANAGDVSWHGFASAIRDEAQARGVPLRIKELRAIRTSAWPTPARRPSWSVLSTEKIEAELGRAPRPWREALRAYLDQALAGPLG